MRSGSRSRADPRRPALAAVSLAELGVVFGDIGTSPLYCVQTVFALDDGIVAPTRVNAA